MRGPPPAPWGPYYGAHCQHCGVHIAWPASSIAESAMRAHRQHRGVPYAWWTAARIVPWGPLFVARWQHSVVHFAWPAASTVGSTLCDTPPASWSPRCVPAVSPVESTQHCGVWGPRCLVGRPGENSKDKEAWRRQEALRSNRAYTLYSIMEEGRPKIMKVKRGRVGGFIKSVWWEGKVGTVVIWSWPWNDSFGQIRKLKCGLSKEEHYKNISPRLHPEKFQNW